MGSPTSTNSSLSSCERFGLSDSNRSKILVYHHRHGVYLSSQQDLCKQLATAQPASQPPLRVSKIPIPWGNSRVEVHQRDLFPESERHKYEHWPNMRSSLASVKLPSSVHWKRLLGQFREMYIVSPEGSPTSSPESSQQISPNSTFRKVGDGAGEEVGVGAKRSEEV